MTKFTPHRVVSCKLGFNEDFDPGVDVDLSLVLHSLLPSQGVGPGEAKCPAVQQDLGNVGKVATQEGEDALQFIHLLEDHQVKGDLESWTPIFITVNKRIFLHLGDCKMSNVTELSRNT